MTRLIADVESELQITREEIISGLLARGMKFAPYITTSRRDKNSNKNRTCGWGTYYMNYILHKLHFTINTNAYSLLFSTRILVNINFMYAY